MKLMGLITTKLTCNLYTGDMVFKMEIIILFYFKKFVLILKDW